jgi:hypothetical protein
MADINVNTQYAYTIEILGGFSGGTAPAGAISPHPVAVTGTGNTINDLSAIALGGFQGLNN